MSSEPATPSHQQCVPRVVLLTCRHHDHIDNASEGKLMQSLVRLGAMATLVAWDDVRTESLEPVGSGHEVYVLRTTWDYWDRLDDFRSFLGEMDRSHAVLLNPPPTVLANLDKTYLERLEAQGVSIVPTIFVERGGEAVAAEQARSRGWSAVVAKPSVGAAASGLERFDRIDEALVEYLQELTTTGMALVQPFMPRVVCEGETSLVYFNGAFSHAVRKVPAAGDFRSQVDFGGVYTLVEPTAGQRRAAEDTLNAWGRAYADEPLYARVDLVPGGDGEPLLGELELIEPELFLHMDMHAADRFAGAIFERIGASRPDSAGP